MVYNYYVNREIIFPFVSSLFIRQYLNNQTRELYFFAIIFLPMEDRWKRKFTIERTLTIYQFTP